MLFQDIISSLNNFWSEKGCLLLQPYDLETVSYTHLTLPTNREV